MNTVKPGANNITQRMKKNNIYQQSPYPSSPSKHTSLSFKGGNPATLITEADRKILNVFSQHYGNVGERLGQKVGKLVTSSDILKKSSRFSLEEGALSIREKTNGRALLENVIFPFVNLPLYAGSWVLKKAQSIPALKNGAKNLYNKPVLRIPRKLNELDSKTDMLKGIFDKTQNTVKSFAEKKGVTPEYLIEQINKTDDNPKAQQLVKEANEYIKESLYKVSNKFFDKYTGNYNTAYERPLNRIVTGLIPVAFLANDAYNLSVLCGDKKEDSKKEAKERQRQEISRVFTTAYIQLLTFGAFTKQVNTIPWFTPLTSALTVLFSETTSRKRLGKPIFFLSKEKAKEYNKKDGKTSNDKTGENKNNKENNKNITQNNYISSLEKEPKIFTSFKSSFGNNEENNKVSTKEQSLKENGKDKTEDKPKKALLNLKTLEKGVAILVSAGFALSFLQNSSYTKNSKLVKGVKSIGKFFKDKVYNKLAYKDFEMSQENFNKLTQSLKDAGCKEIAEGHEFIKNKYSKKSADGIIKMYKSSLPSSKIPEISKSAIEKLKSTGASLSEKECKQIESSVKTAIELHSTDIAENKFTDVANKAAEIIKNKKVNISSEQLDDVVKTVTDSISSKVKETPIQIEKMSKPFVDIVTQPFNFIMSALKLPYKIVSSLIKIVVSPVEKKAAKEAIGEAELSKLEKNIHKAVTEIFGEQKNKSGKISQTVFVNAMERLEKKTKPYRTAEAAYKQAVEKGSSSEEIKKLKTKMEEAKQKLLVYVNTAVEKSFNGVTQSSNKNTDLAMMSKIASSAVTSVFLVADNYNMVMLKSDGEDKEGAKEKANERIMQRLSGLFYQTMLINWFNGTFRTTYNSSLKGMTAVAIPNTLTTEVLTRKSIGMPVGRKSMEELQEIDEKNENRTGIAGKYFEFMRLLTGKKPLKDRLPKENKNAAQEIGKVYSTTAKYPVLEGKTGSSTNILEQLSK